MRAGAYGLSLLSNPLNVQVLGALTDGRLDLPDLHRSVGLPPPTTLRVYLRELVQIGVLDRHQEEDFPGYVSYGLTDSGQELLETGRVLEAWLAAAPERPIALGETAAKRVVKALADGWSSKVLRALAAKPLSLTELDRLIPTVNYPALERRLGAMRSAGQICAARGTAGTKTYTVTNWLRTAVGPLLAAANWEQSRTPDASEPFNRLDAEAAFLLTVPMLEIPDDKEGPCHLAIHVAEDSRLVTAGVVTSFRHGHPTACRSDKRAGAPNAVIGSVAAWSDAFFGKAEVELETCGDAKLVDAVVTSLRRTLHRLESRPAIGEPLKT